MQEDGFEADRDGPARLRWSDPRGDRVARVEVIRRAWHGAYRHIFSPAEIDATFDGVLPMSGGWTSRRSSQLGTVVAELDSQVVGLVGLGELEPAIGEVAALYVLPGWQGRGVGRQLWGCGQELLRRARCDRTEVWALERATACAFYERMGCRRFSTAEFRLGEHAEIAVGLDFHTLG